MLKYSADEVLALLYYYTAYFDSCLQSFGDIVSKFQVKRWSA